MEFKYIADLHLYDEPVIEDRFPHKSADYYADLIVNNWNSTVDESEMVLIVGDIGLPIDKTFDVVRRLHGSKVLVIGNHDLSWGQHLYDSTLFVGTHNFVDLGGTIYVKHIPDFGRELSGYRYFIHGHHHNYRKFTMFQKYFDYCNDYRRLNCAVDHNNYKPCTLQELILNKELLMESYC